MPALHFVLAGIFYCHSFIPVKGFSDLLDDVIAVALLILNKE